jgi:5-(carboxyamino)imidazole ribonucleotide synthase
MINILGERTGSVNAQGMDKALAIPGTYVHIYGKKETKPERKMGHITVIGDKIEDVLKNAIKARKLLSI